MPARFSFQLRLLSSLLILALALAACSSKKRRAMTQMDAGDADSGSGLLDYDANVPPPKKHDAGMAPSGNPAAGLTGNCAIDTNKIFKVVETDTPLLATPFAVDLAESEFAAPFVGEGVGCFDSIYLATLSGASTAPKPVSKLAVDACANEHMPGIAASNKHWLLALLDNRQPATGPQQWDVWVHSYDPKTGKAAAGERISDTPGEETAVAMQTMRDGNVMIAWAETAVDSTSTLYVRPLDPTGKPTGKAVAVDSWSDKAPGGTDLTMNPKLKYGALSMAALGADGAALGYWRYDPADTAHHSEIVFLSLDKTGKPMRSAWVLSGNAGPAGSVDVDINELGGGIVYTQAESQLGRHLWFQQIDDKGQPAPLNSSAGTAPALRILGAPFRGVDVSISKLLTMYAVVYRQLPYRTTDRPQIRIMFLGKEGGMLGDSDISYTSEQGGRTSIRTAYDGRTLISWTEQSTAGKSVVKIVRLPCVGG